MQITKSIDLHWTTLILPVILEETGYYIDRISKDFKKRKEARKEAAYQKAFKETGVSRARWQHEQEHPELKRHRTYPADSTF